MKAYKYVPLCALVVCFCSGTGSAELLGSSDPEVQKNFNRLISTKACQGCDLSGAVLNRVDLSGANLEGANLEGTQLNLTNLAGANLRNANLKKAGLGGADLAGADLRGADLGGAILAGAYFTGALLDEGQIKKEESYEPATDKVPDIFSSHDETIPIEEKAPAQ